MQTDADAVMAEPLAEPYPRRTRAAPELPGCRPITMKREDVGTYDGRFELWDAETETAWMLRDPTGIAHEHPSHHLAGLVQVIASVRGSAIRCCGSMDLERLDECGERWRIMQADQVLYLYPGRARLPDAAGMVIGEHDRPDVVLEVDHTTDVRRGKLRLYEEWGFPEVWVEVPERYSPSRPAGRRPGLTIHLLEDGAYRPSAVSRTFPGWTATEIHTALNESSPSAATGQILDRVGRALGARDGTSPDDTPWLQMHRGEGRAEGRAELLAVVMRSILASRGISGVELPLDARELAGVSDEEVIDALLRCEDGPDFRSRLQSLRR